MSMLYPAMNKLTEYIPNRYMMVNVVARRARQIAAEAEVTGEPLPEKPVTMAIGEVAEGRSTSATPLSRKTRPEVAVIAKVAVQAATYAIDKAYDYLLPEEEVGGQAGCRVLVPFGRGSPAHRGDDPLLHQAVPDKPLKAVRSLLDEDPVITERELRLALWMTRRYFCTFYDALRTVLPAAVWYRTGRLGPATAAAGAHTTGGSGMPPFAGWPADHG